MFAKQTLAGGQGEEGGCSAGGRLRVRRGRGVGEAEGLRRRRQLLLVLKIKQVKTSSTHGNWET